MQSESILFVQIADMKYLLLFFFCVYTAAIPTKRLLSDDEDQGKDIKYSPSEFNLHKLGAVTQDSDDDATIIVSKLSDKKLISLLEDNQKQGLFEILDVDNIGKSLIKKKESSAHVQSQNSDHGSAFFRLNDKEVEPFNEKIGAFEADPNYLAQQKIQNLLYSAPSDISNDESQEKKELLFDILTAQLKKLCCKSSKAKHSKIIQNRAKIPIIQPLLNTFDLNDKNKAADVLQYEQIFLIVNDEVQSPDGSQITYVDPDSLSQNSSVVLLGPITTPLSDSELYTALTTITSELSKPEYSPILQDVSEGKLNKGQTRLLKSVVSGKNSRRFIKPHRCRTRWPQAQGPKWLICTGYLNMNTPSLYD